MHDVLGKAEEWQKLNFRCGLEIHHQILTEKKLFCHCPTGDYTDEYHAEVVRHMRPTLSELGEYDGTALMEFKTRKEIVYRLNRDRICTYEMDDNPPFLINQEAVDVALTIALALKCKIVGELHVIRKQYLDGSIPAGFQRTAIIGVDGEIELSSGKKIPIIQLGLEEDACREVSDEGHRIVFMTDRLSMPIIEVVTEKNLNTPEEAAEACERLGRLLRATQLVRRGFGRGRQDVNVSIEGSTRIEIKGVPKIPRIPELTAIEARRQLALLNLRDEMQKRGFKPGDRPGEWVTLEKLPETVHRAQLQAAIQSGDVVRVIKLPKARGILTHEIAPNRPFAAELSGRVRVIACIDSIPNLYHTDGDEGGLTIEEQHYFEGLVNCNDQDVAVILWGDADDTELASNEILDRYAELIVGIPSETRQALADNTTDFERVLPGPDRMYPDTDSPPYELKDNQIERARKRVPVSPWIREERYRAEKLPEDVLYRLAISRFAPLYDRLVDESAISPMRAGELLTRMLVSLRRDHVNVKVFTDEHMEALLRAMGKGKVFREGLAIILTRWAETPEVALAEILEELRWKPATPAIIEETAIKCINEVKDWELYSKDNIPTLATSLAMEHLIGKASGETVANCVNDLLAVMTV